MVDTITVVAPPRPETHLRRVLAAGMLPQPAAEATVATYRHRLGRTRHATTSCGPPRKLTETVRFADLDPDRLCEHCEALLVGDPGVNAAIDRAGRLCERRASLAGLEDRADALTRTGPDGPSGDDLGPVVDGLWALRVREHLDDEVGGDLVDVQRDLADRARRAHLAQATHHRGLGELLSQIRITTLARRPADRHLSGVAVVSRYRVGYTVGLDAVLTLVATGIQRGPGISAYILDPCWATLLATGPEPRPSDAALAALWRHREPTRDHTEVFSALAGPACAADLVDLWDAAGRLVSP